MKKWFEKTWISYAQTSTTHLRPLGHQEHSGPVSYPCDHRRRDSFTPLRTETTINNEKDFYVGKRLHTYPLYGASAFKPTVACRRLRKSPMIASWQKKPSSRSTVRVRSHPNVPRPCDSASPSASPLERFAGVHLRTALFFTRIYTRILRPGLAQALPEIPCANGSLRTCFNKLRSYWAGFRHGSISRRSM